VVPFHVSPSALALPPRYPMATHEAADRHDTLSRTSRPPLPAGLGVSWMTQAVPFHASASVAASGPACRVACLAPAMESPTAVHAVAELHQTPFR